MTPQDINRVIAEKVMGTTVHGMTRVIGETWNPAERIDHAWMVVEKLTDRFHWSIRTPFIDGDKYWAGLTPKGVTGWNGVPDFNIDANTAPMAICLAALESVNATLE